MELHCREYGAGPAWMIVHGLFGQGSNWHTVARRWSDSRRVLVPDLPNHGRSGRADGYDYRQFARDIIETADARGVEHFAIVGHSMGAKIAMQAAADFPDRLRAFVAVDIAPRPYPPLHNHIIKALMELPLEAGHDRRGLDRLLEETVSSPELRAFFLKSLAHRAGGGWKWRLGLEEIRRDYAAILDAPRIERPVATPALFVVGGRSVFVQDEDQPVIKRLFPHSRLVVIPGASHLVHVDAAEAFDAAVRKFMDEIDR